MSHGLNKAQLIGHLAKDPEIKVTAGGSSVATVNLATNESYKDKNGEQVEKTEWHRLVIWGKQAEIAGEYLKKGQQVYVEGKLQTRSWDDKDGVKHYTTEVVVFNFLMLGSKGESKEKAAAPMEETMAKGEESLPF